MKYDASTVIARHTVHFRSGNSVVLEVELGGEKTDSEKAFTIVNADESHSTTIPWSAVEYVESDAVVPTDELVTFLESDEAPEALKQKVLGEPDDPIAALARHYAGRGRSRR